MLSSMDAMTCTEIELPNRGTVGHTATLVTAAGVTMTAIVDYTDADGWYLLPGANTDEIEAAEIEVIAAVTEHDEYERDVPSARSVASRLAATCRRAA